jgi:tetratricopeptide (TPR) repeat protein
MEDGSQRVPYPEDHEFPENKFEGGYKDGFSAMREYAMREYIITKINNPNSDISARQDILDLQADRTYKISINVPIKLPPGTKRGHVVDVIEECIEIIEDLVEGAQIVPPLIGTWRGMREPNIIIEFDFPSGICEMIPNLLREIITKIQTRNKQMCVRVSFDGRGGEIFDLVGGMDEFESVQGSFGYPDPEVYHRYTLLTAKDDSAYDLAELGSGAQKAGRVVSAEEYLIRSFDVFKENSDHENQACVLLDLANNYDIQGDLDKAEFNYLRALEIVQTHNPDDSIFISKVFGNLGLISSQRGDNKRGLNLIIEGIEKVNSSDAKDTVEGTRQYLQLLNNSASIHLKSDNLNEAGAICKSVIYEIRNNEDYLSELAIAKGNLALVEKYNENYEIAIELLEDVTKYWLNDGNFEQYGVSCGVLGDLNYLHGLYEQSRQWYNKQMDIGDEFNSPGLKASALYGIGVIEMEFDVSKSIRYLKQSLKTEVDLNDKPSILARLFEAHTILSDWSSAENYCKDWLALATQLGDKEGEVRALVNQALSILMGICPEKINRLEYAEFLFDEAMRKAIQLGDEELIQFVAANSIEYEDEE